MQTLSSLINLSQVKSEKTAKKALEEALNYINQDDGSKKNKQKSKRKAYDFLGLILNHLKSESESEQSKFYTMFIMKFITEKDELVILSVLTTHPLLAYLASLAKQNDPYLPMEEKGKYLFRDKKLGNDFMRLVLESIKVWAQRFPSNKKNQQSHFKKTYDDLLANKVSMPAQLKFYTLSSTQKKSSSQLRDNSSKKVTMMQEKGKQNGGDESENMKIMNYEIEKIDKFLKLLEGNDNQKYCHEYHKLFTKQKEKYISLVDKMIEQRNQKGLDTALLINQFYDQQNNAYQEFLANKNDYYSYVKTIQIQAEKLHEALNKNQKTQQYTKKQVKVVHVETRKNNLVPSSNDHQNKQIVSQLMNRLNEKPISASKSFKQIKESLSKQKSQNRFKRSLSGMRKSSVSRFGKSITKSRIANIFTNPPNPYPKDKRYQGQFIDRNKQMENIMRNLTRNQGIRRFITGNFKTKNPLFQNSHIQIGFKSEAIYEEVQQFRVILSLQLFIGNKTEDQINDLSLEFKGDSDLLVYATPKTVKTYLQAGYQLKQQLLIIPMANRFPFISLYLKYDFKGEECNEKIILPNSIIKLTTNGKISKQQFVRSWNASTIFRTGDFKLTRYISPDSLNKYISNLCELSSYDQFLAPESEADYQLGCQVLLMKKYEAVLRISVRPNLNAVLQIGITDEAKEAHQGFIQYLQNLQMLLTHFDHQN